MTTTKSRPQGENSGKRPVQGPATPAAAPDDEPKTGVLGVDVAMTWRGDMHSARFFPRPVPVTVGQEGLFPLPPDVMADKLVQTLVDIDPKLGVVLRFDNPAATGHVIVDGHAHDIAQVRDGQVPALRGPVVPFGANTHAWVQFGDFTFVLRRAHVPPTQRTRAWQKENLLLLLCLLMASALLIIPLVAGYNSPDFRVKGRMTIQEEMEARLIEIEIVEPIEEEKPPEELKAEAKPDEVKKEEAPPIGPPPEVIKEAKEIAKQLDKLTAEEKAVKTTALVKDRMATELAVLDDATGAIPGAAPVLGTRIFQVDDSAGTAANPDGQGGTGLVADPEGKLLAGPGGTGVGKDGTQKAEIAGLNKDTTTGGKKVAIGMNAGVQKVTLVKSTGGEATGELPRDTVKKYIATKMGAVKACYQKGLQSNPALAGKVTVAFLIQPNGAVLGQKVAATTLENDSVESCILNNIKSWRFPQAKGGGVTKVVYPFLFSSH
jgi:hypothetical protein